MRSTLAVGGGALQHASVRVGPHLRIDRLPIGRHHGSGRQILPLPLGQAPVGHRHEPDVGIEPDLVAGMAAQHRPAAGLGKVADQQARPAVVLARLDGQLLHQRDEVGMAPVAVARQAHGLPRGAVDGERLGAREASLGVEADRASRHRRGRLDGAEQQLGRRSGRLRHLLLLGDRSSWPPPGWAWPPRRRRPGHRLVRPARPPPGRAHRRGWSDASLSPLIGCVLLFPFGAFQRRRV